MLVPGTPLTLVSWRVFPGEARAPSFTLVDGDGKPVWALQHNESFRGVSEQDSDAHYENGGLIGVGPSTFDLWFVKDKPTCNTV